jgi:hypothetical protein
MNKYEKKRERIFDIYSENLYHYLGTINLFEMEVVERMKGLFYFCPLCYTLFTKEALIASSEKNHLTLEHNPPKSLGGKSEILTCKNCNNNKGTGSDHLVGKLLRLEDFVVHSRDGSINSRIKVEGKTINAEYRKVSNEVLIKPDKKSNPYTYELLFDKLSKGEKIAAELDLKMPDWPAYSFAILKSAYLKAFELFGYNYADMGNGRDLRECLSGAKEYPCFNNGVIDFFADDYMVGFSIIREPRELQAMVITQVFSFKAKTGSVTKNVPVVLPVPIEGGWERLSNFNSYRNQKVNWRLEKIGIPEPPLNSNLEFHRLFYE